MVVPQPTPDTEIRFSEEIEDPNKRAADCNVIYQVSSKNEKGYTQFLYVQ